MSFENKCSTIIRRASKDIFFIKLDGEISYMYYDENNNLKFSKTIISDNSLDFSNSYFTLNDLDEIYGIYCNDSLKMVFAPRNSSSFLEKDILNYDNTKFEVSFPYFNIIDNNIHIFYYVYNLKSNNTCALFHHFKHNDIWTENKIDFINHIILDKYSIIWNQDIPIIFYFNLINGYEELFFSKFNMNTLTWTTPIQVTNSQKNKLYLNIIKDSLNFYHIVFCEKVNDAYCVKYINGYLNDNMFEIDTFSYLSESSTCMYPSLLKNNNILSIMWVDFGRLYYRTSNNLGKSWSEVFIDELSTEEYFIRSNFFSNCDKDKMFNVNSVFTTMDDVGLLGF